MKYQSGATYSVSATVTYSGAALSVTASQKINETTSQVKPWGAA